MEGIKAFYRVTSAYVRMKGEFSEMFSVVMGMRQRCVMSPWGVYHFYGCLYEGK